AQRLLGVKALGEILGITIDARRPAHLFAQDILELPDLLGARFVEQRQVPADGALLCDSREVARVFQLRRRREQLFDIAPDQLGGLVPERAGCRAVDRQQLAIQRVGADQSVVLLYQLAVALLAFAPRHFGVRALAERFFELRDLQALL